MNDPKTKAQGGNGFTNIQSYVKEANSVLESHRGKEARWWLYLVGHKVFQLKIGDSFGRDGNVVLFFEFCEYLCGPTGWPNQQLELMWTSALDRSYPLSYILKDDSVGFRLEAYVVSWRQNVNLFELGNLLRGSDRMPGFEPRMGVEFHCLYCKHSFYGYHPYCSECGKPMPAREEMQRLGLASPLLPSSYFADFGYEIYQRYLKPDSNQDENAR